MLANHSIVPGEATFQELLGADPSRVLDAMDASGDDVPNLRPEVAVEIGAVGMRRRDIVIAIQDPFDPAAPDVRAVCTVDVSGRVPATRRGLHLSRIGDEVAKSTQPRYLDVADYAHALSRAIADSQWGSADVRVWARVPYVRTLERSIRRPKQSLEHLETMARVRTSTRGTRTDVGIRVPHIVACPCVQRTYRHALRARGERPPLEMPLLTHSQRCVTTVTVGAIDGGWPLPPVLAALDTVLVRTCNTLPRDLELACVFRAHQRPQFIEDAVRAAAVAVAGALMPGVRFRRLAVRSRSLESIHEFDLDASLALDARACADLVR